jgi:hypothetical protein
VVAVPVDARRRNEAGQAVEQLEGSEAKRLATAQIGLGEPVDQASLRRGERLESGGGVNHFTSIGSNGPLCEGGIDMNIHYIGSPKPWLGNAKTCNWLAHQLWHQARNAIFPGAGTAPPEAPHDLAAIRRKAMLYRLINPKRARDYQEDMLSLQDPGQAMRRARRYWSERNIES